MERRELLERTLSAVGLGLLRANRAGSEAFGQGAQRAVRTQHRFSELRAHDGTPLFHRDWGSGPPTLFLHGWGLNSTFWEYQMAFLASHGFRAISFDRRGHGRSGDPGRGYDYSTLADDVAAVVEGLDLRDVTLVGHSVGGAEAVRYVTRHGTKRVARLMLVSATLPFLLKAPDNPAGVDRSAFDALRTALSRNRAKWLADNAAPFWTPDTSSELKDWGHVIPWQCSLHAMLELTHTMSETDFRNELRAVRLRTLLIHGTADHSVPLPFGRATAEAIGGAELREYEGAPHGLPLTHIERFNADVAEFAGS